MGHLVENFGHFLLKLGDKSRPKGSFLVTLLEIKTSAGLDPKINLKSFKMFAVNFKPIGEERKISQLCYKTDYVLLCNKLVRSTLKKQYN